MKIEIELTDREISELRGEMWMSVMMVKTGMKPPEIKDLVCVKVLNVIQGEIQGDNLADAIMEGE